jgi:hypothetical protein
MQLSPDLVLLQYCLNDNYKFLHRVTSKGRWLLTLEAKASLLPEGDGIGATLARCSYLVYAVRRALYSASLQESTLPWKTPLIDGAWDEASWATQEAHIRAIADTLASAKVRFAVFAVPHENQLAKDVMRNQPAKNVYPQTRLAVICQGAAVPYLDLHAKFAEASDGDLYTDRLHLSAKGHALTAEELDAFLTEHGLVPGN